MDRLRYFSSARREGLASDWLPVLQEIRFQHHPLHQRHTNIQHAWAPVQADCASYLQCSQPAHAHKKYERNFSHINSYSQLLEVAEALWQRSGRVSSNCHFERIPLVKSTRRQTFSQIGALDLYSQILYSARTHTSIHTYINTHIHQYTHTSIHTYINTHIHQYTHTSIHTYINTVHVKTVSLHALHLHIMYLALFARSINRSTIVTCSTVCGAERDQNNAWCRKCRSGYDWTGRTGSAAHAGLGPLPMQD